MVQGGLEAQLVPWDREDLPDPSNPVYQSGLDHLVIPKREGKHLKHVYLLGFPLFLSLLLIGLAFIDYN